MLIAPYASTRVHPAAGAVGEQRDVDALRGAQRLERHAPRVAVDEGRGAGGARDGEHEGQREQREESRAHTIASASARSEGRHPTSGGGRPVDLRERLANFGRGHRRGRSPLLPARPPARQGAAVPDRGRRRRARCRSTSTRGRTGRRRPPRAAIDAAVGELNRYPNASGDPLKEALAAYHGVDPSMILLGRGLELARLAADPHAAATRATPSRTPGRASRRTAWPRRA